MQEEPLMAGPLTAFELVPEHDIRNVSGAPGWFELVTPRAAAAEAFLGAVFGWQFTSIALGGGDYRVIELAGHEVGGIRAPRPGESDSPHWLSYVTVDSVDLAAAAAERAGGQIVLPPTDLGDAGRMTAFVHPHAGPLYAFEYRRPFS
jgi:predicted enzyme related to lactoylglutathione lyase